MVKNKTKQETKGKKKIHMFCGRASCMYDWEYSGASKFYATCPRCKSSVRVPSEEE